MAGDILARDHGVAGCLLWGLAHGAKLEPEAVEELLRLLVTREGGSGLSDPGMRATFEICFLAFFLLFLWLVWVRNEGARLRDALEDLHQQVLAKS